jgi:glycerol-3-phosphate dehydrogenase subunit B
MKRQTRHITADLAVIGTGIAGCAASIFARDLGLKVAQIGHSGAMAYTTGYLDLLGVLDGQVLDDPWSGLDTLRNTEARHPMARMANDDILTAFDRFVEVLGEMGLGYTAPGNRNLSALLPFGTVKPTLSLPITMQAGSDALLKCAPALIIDFEGLQGFSATEFCTNMASSWPGLRPARLLFPGLEARPVFPEVMARTLETPTAQEQLADLIRSLLNGTETVGLPAILGLQAPDRVRARIEQLTGATIFEIPTIPPGVPGIRLREAFERELPRRGVLLEPQNKVSGATLKPTGVDLTVQGALDDLRIDASAAVIASGRFLSGGLKSDRHRVKETVLDLPVHQPDTRDGWFSADYLDPAGHPVNKAGIEIDAAFRPLGLDGAPASDRLFAAGVVLARQDWVRQRCGAGLAIATAYGAVQAAARSIHAR